MHLWLQQTCVCGVWRVHLRLQQVRVCVCAFVWCACVWHCAMQPVPPSLRCAVALAPPPPSSYPSTPRCAAQALDALQPGSADFGRLADELVAALSGAARGPATGGMGAVAAMALRRVRDAPSPPSPAAAGDGGGAPAAPAAAVAGLAGARALYRRLLAVPPAGGDFFRAAIEVEQRELDEASASASVPASAAGGKGGEGVGKGGAAAAAARAAAARRALSQLFEAALGFYGEVDPGLWVAYALHVGRDAGAGGGHVYWRAVKALREPDEFVQLYREAVGAAPAG